MGREELTAEALTLLIAGSDTTSKYVDVCLRCSHLTKRSCQLVQCDYLLSCHTPRVQEKLHKELDENLDSGIPTAEQVKNLSYLHACINEGLRLHSTSALGLPRVVPEGGMMILGKYFPPSTVVSVPAIRYTGIRRCGEMMWRSTDPRDGSNVIVRLS